MILTDEEVEEIQSYIDKKDCEWNIEIGRALLKTLFNDKFWRRKLREKIKYYTNKHDNVKEVFHVSQRD